MYCMGHTTQAGPKVVELKALNLMKMFKLCHHGFIIQSIVTVNSNNLCGINTITYDKGSKYTHAPSSHKAPVSSKLHGPYFHQNVLQ